jgi:hypothetical protein
MTNPNPCAISPCVSGHIPRTAPDIEQAFGVRVHEQARAAPISNPCAYWQKIQIGLTIKTWKSTDIHIQQKKEKIKWLQNQQKQHQ